MNKIFHKFFFYFTKEIEKKYVEMHFIHLLLIVLSIFSLYQNPFITLQLKSVLLIICKLQ